MTRQQNKSNFSQPILAVSLSIATGFAGAGIDAQTFNPSSAASSALPESEVAASLGLTAQTNLPISLAENFLAPAELNAGTDSLRLAVSFNSNGLWSLLWDANTWTRVTTATPSILTRYDDGTNSNSLAAGFGASGLWGYDGAGWTELAEGNPSALAYWGGNLAAGFSGDGLWNFDWAQTWQSLSPVTPGGFAADWWGGPLAVDFNGEGLWLFDGDNWVRSATADPVALSYWSDGENAHLASSFGPDGLWDFNDGTGTWSRLSPANAEGLAGWSYEAVYALAVDFGADGLWQWNGVAWSPLSPVNPGGLYALLGLPLLVDFDNSGLWSWNGTTWQQLSTGDAIAISWADY